MAAGDVKNERNAVDALYSLADTMAEQRLLLRQIAANTGALLEMWRNTTSPGESSDAAAPEPVAAPTAAPAPQQAPSSTSDALMLGLISQQLGIDPTVLKGMNESDVMALVMSKMSTKTAGATTPPLVP